MALKRKKKLPKKRKKVGTSTRKVFSKTAKNYITTLKKKARKKKGKKPQTTTAPAMGERRAMGGMLPQYEAFARFAYQALLRNELVWIKIADPEAGKVDDIQYSTTTEVRAYQVKWSNKSVPTPFAFSEFKDLLPGFAAAWKAIRKVNEGTGKRVLITLLTNRPISKKDSIKTRSKKVGSFSTFYEELWIPMTSKGTVVSKWRKVYEALVRASGLDEFEFNAFANDCILTFSYLPKENILDAHQVRTEFDLDHFVGFLIKSVAHSAQPVKFTLDDLVNALKWEQRLATSFNHELAIDKALYQPITRTLNKLSNAIKQLESGYVFLLGGPGTGKSTLLTQWLKEKKGVIARYYVFDFTNPASSQNYFERGDTVSMLFDLVIQLRNQNVFEEKVLPHKDLTYLKAVFDRQLTILGDRYKSKGIPTFLLIDGLDHINREYKNVTKNLISDLPHPKSLPDGVFIILGSQKFDFAELSVDIRSQLEVPFRRISIDPFTRDEVHKYLERIEWPLTPGQEKIIFTLSQGHPLYLSYLANRLRRINDFYGATQDLVRIEGDISIYYRKIWESIADDQDVVDLLALVAMVQGSVRLDFIREWNFDSNILKKFRKHVRFLFGGENDEINFFHNSFRQFVLTEAGTDDITGRYDENKLKKYHDRIAKIYKSSKVEKSWPFAYHLFAAGSYDAFLKDASPVLLLNQLYEYRPIEKIREDLNRGVAIAKERKDVNVLVSYLFALSELQTREQYLDPASFIEQFFELGKIPEIKGYLRDGSKLLCSVNFTLDAVLNLIACGEENEAKLLFSLAEPEGIFENKIEFDETNNADEKIKELEKWFFVATNFYEYQNLFEKIKNLEIIQQKPQSAVNAESLRLRLLAQLSFGLIDLHKSIELVDLLDTMNLRIRTSRAYFFYILRNAIEEFIEKKSISDATVLMKYLLKRIPYKNLSNTEKIIVANLRFNLGKDVEQLMRDLEKISQPPSPSYEQLNYRINVDLFTYRIKLNKLLHIAGIGIPAHEAVPGGPKTNDRLFIEFERKLCLIAELQADAMKSNPLLGEPMTRIAPIINFYYTDHKRSTEWMGLQKARADYFDYLIHTIASFGPDKLKELGEGLINHFSSFKSFWPAKEKRDVIISLASNGYPTEPLKKLLAILELTMLDEQSDVTGRVSECYRQVQAWIALGDFEKAELMITRAIQESMGIGYRKDFQITIWINWLKKVNRDRPELGIERIQWLLARLHHIRDTTELGPFLSAANALLRAAFELDFSAGVNQLLWQLKNGLIHLDDGLSIYLRASLKKTLNESEMTQLVEFYTDYLLYFTTEDSSNLLRKIIDRTFHQFDDKFFTTTANKLYSQIYIYALDETRHDLITELQQCIGKFGLDPHDVIPDLLIPARTSRDDRTSSGNELILTPEHRHVSEEEVITLAGTFDSFLGMVKNEDGANSYFRWDNVLKRIAKNFSLDKLQFLANAYNGHKGSFYFSALSELASELGDRKMAEELAIKAIEHSSMTGWLTNYDGGSRLRSLNAFAKVDNAKAKALAFEMFADDIVRNDYSSSWTEALDDILPLLSDGYGLTDGWPVVQTYLDRLFANAAPSNPLPSLERSFNWPDSIMELLAYMARFPHPVINERAERMLASFLSRMPIEALNFLTRFAGGDTADKNFFMRVISAIHELAPKRSALFVVELKELAKSDNFFLRFHARKILLNHFPEWEVIEHIRQLPGIYSLVISKNSKSAQETRDYFEHYEKYAKLIARQSGLSQQNILYRWEELAQRLNKTGLKDQEIDSQHLNYYESIGIKYPGRRSKYIRINEAMAVVVAELVDARVLTDDQAVSFISQVDTLGSTIKPVRKPPFIPSLEKNKNYLSEEWIKSAKDSERLSETVIEDSGSIVIAEYSEIRHLGWGLPTEVFMSQVSISDEESDQYHIFHVVVNSSSDEYFKATDFGEDLVVMAEKMPASLSGRINNWVALNPKIGKQLGWVHDEEKIFSWKDPHGNTMVESIYWVDGNVRTQPPHDSEVGEGWYVVASQDAFHQLSDLAKKIQLEKRLIRFYDYEGHYEDRAGIFVTIDK
jgi:hypothetical protein